MNDGLLRYVVTMRATSLTGRQPLLAEEDVAIRSTRRQSEPGNSNLTLKIANPHHQNWYALGRSQAG